MVASGAYPGAGSMPFACGHLVAEEPPEGCVAALLGFFREGAGLRPAMRLFYALVAVALLAGGAHAEPVDLELVLAADGSGSIDDDELKLQREGYAAAITDPRVLAAVASGPLQRIALTYIEWGGPQSQHTIVDWAVIGGAASAAEFARALRTQPRQAQGYNSISGAIDYARGLIETNDHAGARQVIDVSGDGPQIGGRPVETARDEAVLAGITINALVVASPGGGYRGPGGMPLDEHYRRDVIGGFGAFVMTVEDRSEFAAAILNKLIEEIADRRPQTIRDRS